MEIIEKKELVNFILEELDRKGFLHKTDDLKEKTKNLLKNFNRLDNAIRHYKKDIERLEKSKNTSSDGPKFKTVSKIGDEIHSTVDNTSLDVIDSRISNLNQTITKIESFKIMVEGILKDKLSTEDESILRKVYFEGRNADDIAVDLNCDKSTIYRKISKSLEDIKIELFANDFIDLMS